MNCVYNNHNGYNKIIKEVSIMEIKNYVGSRIKFYRIISGMSQGDLADALNTTGQSVSRYENGIRGTSPDILYKLSKIFNISIDDLFPMNKK